MPDDTEDTLLDSEDEEEDSEVTDDEEEDVTDEDDVDDENDDEDDDPVAKAIEAALAEARAKWQEEGQREFERLQADAQKREQTRKEREDNEEKLVNSFGETVRGIRNNIKSIKVRMPDGKITDVELSDEFLEESVFKPLNAYNQHGLEAATVQIKRELATEALEALPESVRDEFVEKAADKELGEWLKLHAEVFAPETEWGKNITKQHQLELDKAVTAAEARGFKKGQKAPAGSSPPSSSSSSSSKGKKKVDLTSLAGISRARADGEISEKEFIDHWRRLTNKF